MQGSDCSKLDMYIWIQKQQILQVPVARLVQVRHRFVQGIDACAPALRHGLSVDPSSSLFWPLKKAMPVLSLVPHMSLVVEKSTRWCFMTGRDWTSN